MSFAFETTLASRSFAPWIEGLVEEGYTFHLVFLWLPGPDFAVERVAARVRLGGHGVPRETVQRRYELGLRNFLTLYRPLATTWWVYNSSIGPLRLIAAGRSEETVEVEDEEAWAQISRTAGHAGG